MDQGEPVSAGGENSRPELPSELLQVICVQAALAHPQSAQTLALVSHSVCAWTARARWHTVIITSAAALTAFWRIITEAAPTQSISLPPQPATCVRALFLHLPGTEIFDVSERLLAEATQAAKEQAQLAASEGATWEETQKTRLAPSRSWARLSGMLERLEQLEQLDLSAPEAQLLRPSLMRSRIRELTLSYDGDEEALGALVWAGDASALCGPSPHFPGLRSRLTHLHVVAKDSRADVAGIPLPVPLLEPLRRGSTSPGSVLAAIASAGSAQAPSEDANASGPSATSAGLTHLRYDTRRFSFKPAEIFATRLRPFFTDVRISPSPALFEASPASYSFAGSRHEAPPLGAGAFRRRPEPDGRLQIAQAQASPGGRLLRSWCGGGLKVLKLCWDVPPASTASAPRVAGTDSGGWPQERRGAWTERSGKARVFAAELVEAIAQLFGWHGQAHEYAELASRIRRGWSDKERETLAALQLAVECELACAASASALPDAAARQSGASGTQRQPDASDNIAAPLEFAVRSPASLLKMDTGPAAFELEQRLALFLDRAGGGPGAWD